MSATTSRIRASATACAVLGVTCTAVAGSTSMPNLQFTLGSASGTFSYSAADFGGSWANGNGTFGFAGSSNALTDNPSDFAVAWNLLVSPDPFIIGNILVTNTTAVTQELFVDISLPTGFSRSATLVGGSISASVTDLNGNGATLASIGDSGLFSALTDVGYGTQSVASTLLTSASVTAGSNMSASLAPAAFGDPIPSQLHGPVYENITIRFRFTLTAGDAASFTSIFAVQAVPAPGAAVLLGMAGLTAGRRRRR
jgi:MYXO-CTERM domain-containing protein